MCPRKDYGAFKVYYVSISGSSYLLFATFVYIVDRTRASLIHELEKTIWKCKHQYNLNSIITFHTKVHFNKYRIKKKNCYTIYVIMNTL